MIVLRLNNPEKCMKPSSQIVWAKKGFGPFSKKVGPKELNDWLNQLKEYARINVCSIVAANEAGLSHRMIYVRKGTLSVVDDCVFINPKVIKAEGHTEVSERFITRKDIRITLGGIPRLLRDGTASSCATVRRPYKITVSYETETGEEATIELEGIDATIFLQQYHLLEGITPIDIGKDVHDTTVEELNASSSDDYKIITKDGENKLHITFKIKDMGKGCCSRDLESIIKTIPGVLECTINLFLKEVSVTICDTLGYESKLRENHESKNPICAIRTAIENYKDEGIPYEIARVIYTVKGNSPASKGAVGAILGGHRQASQRPVAPKIIVDTEPVGRAPSHEHPTRSRRLQK